MSWAVLRTAPCYESKAAANAENKLNLESYAPRIKTFNQVKPLFPGYSFVRTPKDFWARLLRLRHVRGILMAGDHPSWLAPQIIEQIRTQEHNGLIPCNPRFTYLQRLAIRDGPFTHGLYLGISPGNRVRLLFELLGKNVESQVELGRIADA